MSILHDKFVELCRNKRSLKAALGKLSDKNLAVITDVINEVLIERSNSLNDALENKNKRGAIAKNLMSTASGQTVSVEDALKLLNEAQ